MHIVKISLLHHDLCRGDVELYMPNFLYRRYQRDCKVRKKLKEVFDRFYMLSVDDGHYINKFLEVYEKDAMCGKHAFPLKQVCTLDAS